MVVSTIKRAADGHNVMAAIRPAPKPSRPTKPKKRKKKTPRQQLERQLDAVVREIVLKRDGRCVVCGKTTNLQCGHLITRTKRGVRWDLKNCNVQCAGCNFYHEHNPHPYTHWFIQRYGLPEYESLYARSEAIGKFTLDELETMLIELTEKAKEQ